MLERTDVTRRIAASAGRRVTVLAAPPGYGKTVAIDAYVRGRAGSVLRFNVRRWDTSLARFVRSLAGAFEHALPRMGRSLGIAYERAIQSEHPERVLAAWFAEHLGNVPRTIVIDDLHHCTGADAVFAFLAGAIERTGTHVRWIVAVRLSEDLPLSSWFARGDAARPIDENVLRLTENEALALGARLAPMIPPATVLRLRDRADGAAGVFAFALRTLALDATDAEGLIASGGGAFDRFADYVFAGFSSAERTRLIESVALPDIDAGLLVHSYDGAAWIAAVEERAPQIFRVAGGHRQYVHLFYDYLRERLEERGDEAMRAATVRAASALEKAGRIDEALALYARERHDAGLLRLVETHGFAYLDAGRGEAIHEAVAALDPEMQARSATVLAMKAVWQSLAGRFEAAESLFAPALDRADAALRAHIAYEYGTHFSRFARPEAVDVFEQLADAETIGDTDRAYALASLGSAYVAEHRFEDAHRVAEEALVLATASGSAHTIAKAHLHAAHVALHGGDGERAKRLAAVALEIADEHGYLEIANGALGIAYHVAADVEDDAVDSLRILGSLGECAAESGSSRERTTALATSFEIEIERNNEIEAGRIERELRMLGVYDVPDSARALRASWGGDFAGAYRILERSADAGPGADDRALRQAEIAVYAAGAGLQGEAAAALAEGCSALGAIAKVDPRVQRARLLLALAAIVAGRCTTAARLLALVDAPGHTLSPRLAALRDVLGELTERYRGSHDRDRLFARLVELDRCGFAGLARMISKLPPNVAHRRDESLVLRHVPRRRETFRRTDFS